MKQIKEIYFEGEGSTLKKIIAFLLSQLLYLGPTNLILDTYDYSIWFEKEESADTIPTGNEKEKPANMSSMAPSEDDEKEVKEGKYYIKTSNITSTNESRK